MAAEVDAPVARNISHYEVLGIKQDATSKEIKQAFFKKSKQLHPDSNPTNPELHSQFVKLSEAYNVLSKEKSRRDYDTQQTIQKSWQRPDRDPFGDLHLHRQPRNRKTREHPNPSRHSAEGPLNSDDFRAAGTNPGPYGDDAYWQEFRKTPPEWYSDHEFKRRHQRNLRIVMYCFLIMSGSLLVHFVSYSMQQPWMAYLVRMTLGDGRRKARSLDQASAKRTPSPEQK